MNPMKIMEQEPMSRHTTFRTGGPARWFCPVSSVSEIRDAITFAKDKSLPLYVIGRGSNLLVSDAGLQGVVMEIGESFREIETEGCRIKARAGAGLGAVAAAARDAGLAGMEFASGIPGSLGGAVSMNAGAYGGEMKDIVEEVEVLKDGEIVKLSGPEMHFAYRHSRCNEEAMIILGAVLKLAPGDEKEITEKMRELNLRRREKQPLEYPSAGSTFKRPEGYFAGKLIQDAGLRGFSIGGASVSEKHCGFVINKGGATSEEIYRLIRHVQDEVDRQFGVKLETEVKLLGDFA